MKAWNFRRTVGSLILGLTVIVEAFAGALDAESGDVNVAAASGGEVRATVHYDVEYGRAGGERLLLDASVPAGGGPHPVAIIVHGGGWGSGDKQMDITGLFKPLTAAGFVWFSVNYRLAPEHRWPAAFEDVQTAIRWVREHAVDYEADPNRLALIGYSAGGQLVALAAEQPDAETQVQAVVGIAPAADLVTDTERRGKVSRSLQDLLDVPEALNDESLGRIRDISPAAHIKPGMPAFLLLQGSADRTVLPEHTASFAEALRQAGVDVEVVTLKDAPHRLSEWDNFEPDYRQVIADWLKTHLGDK